MFYFIQFYPINSHKKLFFRSFMEENCLARLKIKNSSVKKARAFFWLEQLELLELTDLKNISYKPIYSYYTIK